MLIPRAKNTIQRKRRITTAIENNTPNEAAADKNASWFEGVGYPPNIFDLGGVGGASKTFSSGAGEGW